MDIVFRTKDIELTDDLKAFAQKKIGTLDKFLDKVTELRVELSKESNHHKRGDIYRAAVEMDVPGKMLFSQESAEDIESAIVRVKDEMQKVIDQHKGHRQAMKRDTAKLVRGMKEEGI